MEAATFKLATDLRKQVANNRTTTTSAPTGSTDGTEFGASYGNDRYRYGLIQVSKASGAGDVTLTGPVKLYGYRDGGWWYLGQLNDGSDIVVGAQGYAEIVQGIHLHNRFEMTEAGVTASHGYSAHYTPILAHGA